MEILESRLRNRGTESEEDVKKRLGNAAEEMEYGMAEGNVDRVFVNNDLKKTFAEVANQFKTWYPNLVEG